MTNKSVVIEQHPTLGPCYKISSRTGEFSAKIFGYGAQVASYQVTTRAAYAQSPAELLFVSEKATFSPGLPIRGGIPLCFPQFADRGDLPFHGFARTAADWRLLPEESSQSKVTLRLDQTTESLRQEGLAKLWPHRFELSYTVELNDQNRLETTVTVINRNSAEPFSFTIALHTYFAVSDISEVAVSGLQGLEYLDKTRAGSKFRQEEELLKFEGEVNRIYLNTPSELLIKDRSRRISLIKSTSLPDAVTWNPGEIAAATFKDLAPNEYRKFVCVEAGAIKTPVTLNAGQMWQGSQVIGG